MSVEIEDRPRTLTEGFLADARRGMDIALPGRGGTAERFAHLRQCAAIDASLGRLVESHTDAVALLREAGRTPPPGAALAVWASDAREWLLLQRSGPRFRLRGTKQFCGGATLVDVALLTVPFDDAPFEAADAPTVLVIVPMGQPGIRVDPTVWTAPAFTDAGISTVRFDIELDASCIVGPPDFYTERPGFWQGAVGVAAVWAGIGDGLISRAAFRAMTGWPRSPVARSPLVVGPSTQRSHRRQQQSTGHRWGRPSKLRLRPATSSPPASSRSWVCSTRRADRRRSRSTLTGSAAASN